MLRTVLEPGSLGTDVGLHGAFGFRRVEEKPGRLCGVEVVEERWDLGLALPP